MTLHKSQDERRRDILDAARRRFVADGYARARLNDVAADAGLSKGGVYFHFKSKREIFDALIDEDNERVLNTMTLMRAVKGPVADKIAFFAREGLKLAAANPHVAKFQIVMGEMALAHDDVREQLASLHEAYVAEVVRLLKEGVASGELRPDLDADTGARLLVSLMDGVRAAIAADLHRNRELDKLIQDGARLVMDGFLKR